jgi:ABC-2 type transport system permease protein
MNGLLTQLKVGILLHFRNRMALIYSYIFPTIFLVSFWVLYRYENPPLVRHIGELLTITILGGACFGLPTTMVSERERGVWRRYRLTPVPTASVVTSTVAARYLLLMIAGALQLALALLIGMPWPQHPFELWVAFTFVAFAFMGLGLVIAMMADNVPAVQALGQCIFLPMLILGGIAVPLESLPEWAQTLSAFFPGRHAVEAFRAVVSGDGLRAGSFTLLALGIIAAAGCLAAAKLFRWDSEQRFTSLPGKGWVAVALASWIAVGVMSELRPRPSSRAAVARTQPADILLPADTPPAPSAAAPAAPEPTPRTSILPTPKPSAAEREKSAALAPPEADREKPATRHASPEAPSAAPGPAPDAPPAPPPGSPRAEPWRSVTVADIDREIDFTRIPPDCGIVTQIARPVVDADPDNSEQIDLMWYRLPQWPPGKVDDPVQRVRNILYVAAVPDVFQMPIERFAPLVVYERLEQQVPKEQLVQNLYWIALHPADGDDSAAEQLYSFGIDNGAVDKVEVRNRAAIYAVKLLGRLLGRIASK